MVIFTPSVWLLEFSFDCEPKSLMNKKEKRLVFVSSKCYVLNPPAPGFLFTMTSRANNLT